MASAPTVVSTQVDLDGNSLATQSTGPSLGDTPIDLSRLPKPASNSLAEIREPTGAVVGSGFLFDGLLLRDLQRMDLVPRTLPDGTLPNDLR